MKKTPKYRRMTKTDRLIIERLYNSGASYRSISSMTGFAVSSIHTEIRHGLYPHLGAETTRRHCQTAPGAKPLHPCSAHKKTPGR